MKQFSSRHVLSSLVLFTVAPTAELQAQAIRGEIKVDQRSSGKEARMSQWRSWRYGLFIHWGPYSKFGGTYGGKLIGGNTEWIMRSARIPRDAYRKAAADFDPKNYDPAAIVSFAKEAGFRYIILTAKHYDGFALFDSKASDFDAVDVLPSKRDLVGELSDACKSAGLPLGFSYSLNMDWYHPGADVAGPIWDPGQVGSKNKYLEELALPQVWELTRNYGPVAVMMFDNGHAPSPVLASKFAEAVGENTACAFDFTGMNKGDYLYTDVNTSGNYFLSYDWEKCTSAHDSWGFRNEPAKWKEATALLRELVTTASHGGNYLLNIGLDGEGGVPPQARERLSFIGSWLGRFGDSIYGTSRTPFMRHTWKGGATMRDRGKEGCSVYLHFFENPGKDLILPDLITEPLEARLLGGSHSIPVSGRPGAWKLDFSDVEMEQILPVVEVKLPCAPAFGRGPICCDFKGNFRLAAARAVLSGSVMKIGRTPASADLRMTGFADDNDRATWEVYVEKSTSLSLNLQSLPEATPADKKVVVTIDGKELEPLVVDHSPNDASKTDKVTPVFSSRPFSLVPGLHKITVSGARDQDQPKPLVALRVRLLKL